MEKSHETGGHIGVNHKNNEKSYITEAGIEFPKYLQLRDCLIWAETDLYRLPKIDGELMYEQCWHV